MAIMQDIEATTKGAEVLGGVLVHLARVPCLLEVCWQFFSVFVGLAMKIFSDERGFPWR
jgi:hypothetical protein